MTLNKFINARSPYVPKELFDKLLTNNDLLPLKIKRDCDDQNLSKKAIIICDFIASMTDRSATANHAKVIEQKNL